MDKDAGVELKFRLLDPADFERVLASLPGLPGIATEPEPGGESGAASAVEAAPAGTGAPAAVEPFVAMQVRRRSMRIATEDGGRIRVTGESGSIRVGDRTRSVCDVTLELLIGSMADLVDLATLVAEMAPMYLAVRTLDERAQDLGKGTLQDSAAPGTAGLDRRGRAVDGIRRKLRKLLREAIRRQELFLDAPDGIEELHRLRVSIRRFRALLSFLRPALPPGTYDRNQDLLRRLGRSFAPLRDLDVLLDTWEAIQATYPESDAREPSLKGLLQAERTRLETETAFALSHGSATPVFLEHWRWLNGEAPFEDEAWTDLSVAYEVPHRLKKWRKALRAGLDVLQGFDPAAVHALRIRCKKLRYVLEECAEVLPAKLRKRTERVRDLQDLLGAVFDTHRGIEVLDALTTGRRSSGIQYERGVLTGFLQYRCAELYAELAVRKRRI